MAKHIYTYVDPCSPKHLDQACRFLEDDGVIAYPTDVNWAFGCKPSSKKAMERIRRLKPHHPKEQPFSLLCNSLSMVASVANVDHVAYRLLKKSLPGPYTFIMKRHHELPKQIKDKRKNVGVRVPQAPLVLGLIEHFGGPLATTSMPAPSPEEAVIVFGYQVEERYGHGIDLILDLGEEVPPQETTIVDFSEGDIEVVREGLGPTELFKI